MHRAPEMIQTKNGVDMYRLQSNERSLGYPMWPLRA